MPKTLKLWNGRRWDCRGQLYIAAYSRAHAVRLVNEAALKLGKHARCTDNEAREYWSVGCWGTTMAGITPEVGVWMTEDDGYGHGGPVRRIL